MENPEYEKKAGENGSSETKNKLSQTLIAEFSDTYIECFFTLLEKNSRTATLEEKEIYQNIYTMRELLSNNNIYTKQVAEQFIAKLIENNHTKKFLTIEQLQSAIIGIMENTIQQYSEHQKERLESIKKGKKTESYKTNTIPHHISFIGDIISIYSTVAILPEKSIEESIRKNFEAISYRTILAFVETTIAMVNEDIEIEPYHNDLIDVGLEYIYNEKNEIEFVDGDLLIKYYLREALKIMRALSVDTTNYEKILEKDGFKEAIYILTVDNIYTKRQVIEASVENLETITNEEEAEVQMNEIYKQVDEVYGKINFLLHYADKKPQLKDFIYYRNEEIINYERLEEIIKEINEFLYYDEEYNDTDGNELDLDEDE